MEKRKMDRRARYTRMVLKESLLTLMENSPISKISVKELCEKADVNRTTFYAHFNDIEELLNQIENDLLTSVRKTLVSGLGSDSVSAMLMDILSAIKENRDLCTILFGDHGDRDCLERILKFAHDQTIETWSRLNSKATASDLEKLFLFFCNGSIAIIREWVLSGMKESISSLALFIDRLSNIGLESITK